MSWKYFTSRFGKDAVAKIIELRKEFPNHEFAAGVRKDVKGIWILKDQNCKSYGEHYELENGDYFYSPSDENIQKLKETLNKFEVNYEDKISVKLKSGVNLNIWPASAIPKKVLLGLRKKVNTEELPYNTSTRYGELAYKLLLRSQAADQIKITDNDFSEFISLVIKNSYNLPLDVIDSLGIVSQGDYDPLFAAGMGFDYEYLLKEIPLSNGQ